MKDLKLLELIALATYYRECYQNTDSKYVQLRNRYWIKHTRYHEEIERITDEKALSDHVQEKP